MSDQLAPRVVLLTAPSAEVAGLLARSFVTQKLAACVNRLPGVVSTYRWEGQVNEDAEVLLIIKTTLGRLSALETAVNEEHPYETPEFVALEPGHVSEPYLQWLRASVSEGAGE